MRYGRAWRSIRSVGWPQAEDCVGRGGEIQLRESTGLLVLLHQSRQRGERVVGCLGGFRSAQRTVGEILLIGVTRVLVVVAIQAFLLVTSIGM